MNHKLIFPILIVLSLVLSTGTSALNYSILASEFENRGVINPASEGNESRFSIADHTLNTNGRLVHSFQQDRVGNSIYLPVISKPGEVNWPMAGANPQRTSWVAEEVRGKLKPLWYRPIEPYILPRVQVIAAYDTLYISTARGLYAFDAASGADKWVYPTELPLGHSPTIYNGVAYVGGFDRKIHAIDAYTGAGLWTFEAGAGFDTNPLVVADTLYAGDRDGFFYAVNIESGQPVWKYKTGGPIHFSAAYKTGVVYFASDDSYAYALDAEDGELIWKSAKLPGSGFHSWWPVIHEDYIIFAGSSSYHYSSELGSEPLRDLDKEEVFPNYEIDPKGTLVGPLGSEPGDWVAETPTIDTSNPTTTSNGSTKPVTEYFEGKPWRRTYFVFERATGEEYTTDFDGDGKPEYAPILWFGNEGFDYRFPPVVGGDGVLYQTNMYMSNDNFAGGQVSGWEINTPFISVISSDWGAIDEPHAYSAGGDLIYWNLCCDRQFGSIDLSFPNTRFSERYNSGVRPPTGHLDSDREWIHINYNLPELIPDYNAMTYVWVKKYYSPNGGVYGGRNGSYGWHGDGNPPIPYKGRVYIHRSNAIIAFSPDADITAIKLPLAETKTIPEDVSFVDSEELESTLEVEVRKILESGHLKPGYMSSGRFDIVGKNICGDYLSDYWHTSGDMILTLIKALPHLPEDLQGQTKLYLKEEFDAYPPYQFHHLGWKDGVDRDDFILPPEVVASMTNFGPRDRNIAFDGWDLAPQLFYALWKYAEVFPEGAKNIFDLSKDKLEGAPSNDVLIEMPHVHNAYIAGDIGYLELQKLAGYPESAVIRTELERLIDLRTSTFSKDAPDSYFTEKSKYYCRALNVARNFMYLVPELAQHLRENNYFQVQDALDEYETIAPYWFVSKAEVAYGEGVINHHYDYHAIFQAKAMIIKETQGELTKYLDIPAFPTGDLFYIQNLILAIEAGGV